MAEVDLEVIERFIKSAVAEALKDPTHCRFQNVSNESARQLSHALGMISDLGEGTLASGIEEMRENHKWLKDMRTKSARASSAFFILAVTTLGAGMLSALWVGLKEFLKVAK